MNAGYNILLSLSIFFLVGSAIAEMNWDSSITSHKIKDPNSDAEQPIQPKPLSSENQWDEHKLSDASVSGNRLSKLHLKFERQILNSTENTFINTSYQKKSSINLPRNADPNFRSEAFLTNASKPVFLSSDIDTLRSAFDALSAQTGVNFLLDQSIKTETKLRSRWLSKSLGEAIDILLSDHGLEKKMLTTSVMLIYPATSEMRKTYQDVLIRTLFLKHLQAKNVADLAKSLLKVESIHADERLNMLVMRDRPEVIAMLEKLIRAHDHPDAEVVLDIELFETSRHQLEQLGIGYPDKISTITAKPLTLQQLNNLNARQVDLTAAPNLRLNKQQNDIHVLSHPNIRVQNKQNAKVRIGDKVPLITTVVTPNVGISENVQYLDIGLSLAVTPEVTLEGFVNIKLDIEVSTLGSPTKTNSGGIAYTIGTRQVSTEIRLKNNETQVLTGLILDEDRQATQKIPGLSQLPWLGRLFSQEENQRNQSELMMVITPRIVAPLVSPDSALTSFWSGTEYYVTDRPFLRQPATSNQSTFIERLRQLRSFRSSQQNKTANP